jgi:membrane-associated phospholipid phosphatase
MRSRLQLPLLAVVAVVLVVVLAGLVSNDVTDGLDLAIIRAVRASALVAPLAILRQVTELGSTTAMMVLAVVLLVSELVARRPWSGITGAATIGLASLGNELAKDLIARARPDLIQPIVVERGYSFPSGHAALSMVGYGVAALLVARSGAPRGVKVAAAFAAGCLVALIGISRVYLGAHFPTDVLAGWLAGGAVVLIFAWLSPASKARAGAPAASDPAGPRSDPPGKP